MKRGNKKGIFAVLSVLMIIGSVTATVVEAKEVYPSKPVTIIVAYPPGASNDITTRGIATYMSQYLNTNVIISNIPGVGGDIGHAKAYAAKPDGYTLLGWNALGAILSEHMHEVRFKTLKFTPIAAISTTYHILVGRPDGFNNAKDFMKHAKNNSVNIGNNGQFSITGLQGRLMEQGLGIKVNWVNYSGAAEAVAALAGKHLDGAINTITTSMPLIKAGKIVPLLVYAENRLPQLPDVPVPGELGLDFPLLGGSSFGIVGPPGLDKEKLKILENVIMKSTKNPGFIAWMERLNTANRIFFSPDAYRKEIERLSKLAEKFKSVLAKD